MILSRTKIRFLIAGLMLLQCPLSIQAQNLKADGYMGLWTRSPQMYNGRYLYMGGLGTFSSQLRPMAVYSPEFRKTFFVYSGTSSPETSHLQIMVSLFDHRSGKVPRPVVVYDKMGVNDPQDNASIAISNDGYIYVFISGRGRTRPGLVFKSDSPGSIEQFSKIFEGEMIFPQPWILMNNSIFVFYTKVLRGREVYWSTSTGGSDWSEGIKLAGMGGHDQVSGKYGNTVFSVFNYHPGGDRFKRTNLYLIKSDDMGLTWKNAAGTPVSIPVTEKNSNSMIRDYESEGKLVFIYDLTFDSKGNPVILTLISNHFLPGPQGDPRELMIIKWTGKEWSYNKVTETDDNYDMGTLIISDDMWKILSPTGSGPQKNSAGGEIRLWTSTDEGETWTLNKTITENSTYNHTYPRRVFEPDEKFAAFWADGDATKLSESHLYFTDSKFGKVWRLPYKMEKDIEKPFLLK